MPELVADLARHFALVAVISGRPTAFLVDALGQPPGLTLAGLYGLERALHGPEHDAWAAVIDAVVAEATASAPPGVYVEPKGLTVTLHWRQALEQEGWVLAFAERQRLERGLMVHRGRHERELRPPLAVDKGTVVRSLVREHDEAVGRPGGPHSLRHVAAFGDDVGDLPVFVALGELGAAGSDPPDVVRVAAVDTESPTEVAALADLTVPGAAGAVELLRAVAAVAAAAAAT